jgi:hypothetical protein
MKNQCQGCQAGWPIVKIDMFGIVMHEVIGGYAREKVMCTKKDYKESDSKLNNTGE